MCLDVSVQHPCSLSFREGVWFFPVAFALHVFEEWPTFATWAQRHASERFTRRDYLVIHASGFVISVLSAGLLWLFPNPWMVFVFFAFVFAPSVFFNSVFHAGASLVSGTYCPGLVTSIACYLPVFYLVIRLAFRDGMLSLGTAALSLVMAGVFHVLEVGHNVYKAW